MQFPLPIGSYKLLSEQEIETFDFNLVNEERSIGYYVKCDIENPLSLHMKI